MNGINQSAYVNSIASEYQNTRSYGAKDERVKKQPAASEKEKLNDVKGRTIGEPKLSDKALKYYEQLKKKYSNMEFVLVSPDKKAEVERNKGMYASNKELLVLIDSDGGRRGIPEKVRGYLKQRNFPGRDDETAAWNKCKPGKLYRDVF